MVLDIILRISRFIGIIAIVIIFWGVLVTLYRFLIYEYLRMKRHYHMHKQREILRHTFGTYLLLGLEFLIAADIIKTVIEFTWKDLGMLSGIVVIRTIIAIFLDREVEDVRHYREIEEEKEK
ncbi:MAG: DUF1622 domain-containing protein [bacterium]